MATVAGALSAIVALVVILATIDYCLMTSWGKPPAEYEAYALSKKIQQSIDEEIENNAGSKQKSNYQSS